MYDKGVVMWCHHSCCPFYLQARLLRDCDLAVRLKRLAMKDNWFLVDALSFCLWAITKLGYVSVKVILSSQSLVLSQCWLWAWVVLGRCGFIDCLWGCCTNKHMFGSYHRTKIFKCVIICGLTITTKIFAKFNPQIILLIHCNGTSANIFNCRNF